MYDITGQKFFTRGYCSEIVSMKLKGPKHEKFVARIFTKIRPVWIGELETKPKTSKKFGSALYSAKLFLALSVTALKNCFCLAAKKKLVSDCFCTSIDLGIFFLNFEFLICFKKVFNRF